MRSDIPGLKKRVSDCYPSLRLLNVQNLAIDNRERDRDHRGSDQVYLKVLQLGFDVNHDGFSSDFRSASEIKLSTGKILLALEDEELDDKGNFKPTIERKLVIDNLPIEIAHKP